MLQYERYLPEPALQHMIQCYWEVHTGAQPQVLDLVSDGHPELIFPQYAGLQLEVAGEQRHAVPMMGLIGQLTRRTFLFLPPNNRITFIKLYPWTPHLLFRAPSDILVNNVTDLEGLPQQSYYRDLSHSLRSVEELKSVIPQLNLFFLRQLALVQPDAPFIQFAVHQIFRTNGTLPIDTLRKKIHASRRYVEKAFKKHVGMTPKQYARLIRVKKASLLLLEDDFCGNINQVAASLGYYDQSHFLKDFKQVAGRTPTSFLQQQGSLPLDKKETYLQQWDYS